MSKEMTPRTDAVLSMSDADFEALVAEGIAAIPERFLSRLENIAIVIADTPTPEQLAYAGLSEGDAMELLGLYEGIPLPERGAEYGMVLPDRITVFKLPTLDEAEGDRERVREIVRDTVWHEIGHYFGYDDAAIEAREDAGTNHSH